MNKLRLLIPCAVLAISSSISAQEHFFDNGFYVGLNANANYLTRDKKISYASTGRDLSSLRRFDVKVKDWAASPSLTIGYKLDEYDSVSLRGDWARYFRSRSSTNAAHGITSVDGSATILNLGLGTNVNVDWNSDVANFEFEYQRKLWSDNSAAALGFLGLRYRYENQKLDGTSTIEIANFRIDTTHEQLREHLYGPYTGLKLHFKSAADSRLATTLKTSIGWLFKNADLRARNTFSQIAPGSFAQNDDSSRGTVVADVGLNFLYSVSKSLFLDMGYNFNWIGKTGHIASAFDANLIGPDVPARIVDSAVLTHSIGFSVFYKF